MFTFAAADFTEFVPLALAAGVGVACAGGGLFAARHLRPSAFVDAVPSLALRGFAVLALVVGLGAMIGVVPVSMSPLAIMGSLFVGFVTLALCDFPQRSRGVVGGGLEATVEGLIAGRGEHRKAA